MDHRRWQLLASRSGWWEDGGEGKRWTRNTEDDVPEPSRDAPSPEVRSDLRDMLAVQAEHQHEALAGPASIRFKGSRSEGSSHFFSRHKHSYRPIARLHVLLGRRMNCEDRLLPVSADACVFLIASC